MESISPRPDAPIRFSVLHRFLHLVVMFGFTGLAVTGLSLAFSSTVPARGFIWLIGGTAHAAWLHRCCAIFTYGSVVIHGLWFLYYKFGLSGAWTGAAGMASAAMVLSSSRDAWRRASSDARSSSFSERIFFSNWPRRACSSFRAAMRWFKASSEAFFCAWLALSCSSRPSRAA